MTRGDRQPGFSGRAREALTAYGMLAPVMAVFGLFFFWPFYRLIHYALYQQNLSGTRERYVGPSQITDTLSSHQFLQGLKVTTMLAVFSVPIGLVIGTLLAVVAHRRLRGIKVFQTIFSSTIASSAAVTGVVFFTLVNPEIGVFKNVPWLDLNQPWSALFGISLSVAWQCIGLSFVIVLAGLQTVPEELMEAATLDGYGSVRRFFRVTVPLISPTLLFLTVVLAIRTFQVYAEIEILTQGGPAGNTESILYKVTQLQQPHDLGVGASMALGLFVVTLVVAAAQFGLLDRRVHYGD